MDGADTAFSSGAPPPDVQNVLLRLDALERKDGIDVWARLARDEWKVKPLLDRLNKALPVGSPPISRAQLGAALAHLVRDDVSHLAARRWPRYVLGAAAIVLVIASLHPNGPFRSRPAPVQLVAARDIPPYHVIVADDVNVLPSTAQDSASEALPTSLKGRYTTRPIPKGTVFTIDMHADAAAVPGLSERRIATLKVLVPDASLSMSLPARVTLSAPSGTQPIACADAWVLALRREPPATTALATVALPPCTAKQLNALLAARVVALVWEARP
jgi:hypothetical protein